MKQLLEILESMEFEDNGWLRIHATTWEDAALDVVLDVRTGVSPTDQQLWTVRCDNVSGYRLVESLAYDIETTEEHVVLLPHTAPRSELFFSGSTRNPSEVIGKLWVAHERVAGRWLPFRQFLNTNVTLTELLASGSGALAKGPKPLLAEYATVLADCGLQPSLVGEHEPKRWVDNQWVLESQDLKALIMEDSFVVAENFCFRRAPG